MVDGLHILTQNRTKKPLAIALSGAWRGLRGRDGGGDLTNVQHKPIWNHHNESPMYNKYILMKNRTLITPHIVIRTLDMHSLITRLLRTGLLCVVLPTQPAAQCQLHIRFQYEISKL
jgi:hypothetical protein